MRRLPAPALGIGLLLVALALAACDGGDDPVEEADATTTSAPEPEPEPEPVEFPGGGPIDRVFPPGDPAYQLLSSGDCDGLLSAAEAWVGQEQITETEGTDTVLLYLAAGRACQGDFAGAAEALASMGSPPAFNRNPCSRTVVLDWVEVLVASFQADPGFAPELVASDDANPCPDETE